MIVGHAFANLTDELFGRRGCLTHIELDFVYLNHNAVRGLTSLLGTGIVGAVGGPRGGPLGGRTPNARGTSTAAQTPGHNPTGLRILKLNACEHLTDESVELLLHTAPDLELLRLRKSDGFTDLALEHLIRHGENPDKPDFKLELEPSYSHSAFQLSRLRHAYNKEMVNPALGYAMAVNLMGGGAVFGGHGGPGRGRRGGPEKRLLVLEDKLNFKAGEGDSSQNFAGSFRGTEIGNEGVL